MRNADKAALAIACPRGHDEGSVGRACFVREKNLKVCGARWRRSRRAVP